MGEVAQVEWQEAEQLPTRVKGGEMSLHRMIEDSHRFATRWGAAARVTEPVPEPVEPIPGDGLPVNLVSGTLEMGGAERQTVELALALQRLGYRVTIGVRDLWAPHRPLLARVCAAGIRVEGPACLQDAPATIWWGSSMEHRRPPGSIYVAHSSSGLVQRAIQQCADDIDRIVGVSRMATAVASAALPGVPASTVWNGVSVPARAAQAARSGGAFVVGYLGRYDTEKGVPLALAALQHLPETVRLRCYGRGPHKGALAAAADEHGVGDQVDICGVVDDLASVAHELDCLIVPDLIQGLPMTVCEALLVGLPVVGVALGDMGELLADGRGVVVDPTPRALAHGVAEVMGWQTRPAGPTAWALDHLTAEAMAAGYSHVIQEVARC